MRDSLGLVILPVKKISAGLMPLTVGIMGCAQDTDESKDPAAPDQAAATFRQSNSSQILGQQIYQQVCMACHDTGVMEAPKFGDTAAWAELIAEGYGVLVYESIKGEGNMPPRGGNPALTDMEVAYAVAYLANAAGADFLPPQSEQALQALLSAAKIEVEQTDDGHEE
jgi:cytochrome c5